jgi:hypothetical protein
MKFLTDEESNIIREQLIEAGILTPATDDELIKRKNEVVFSTTQKSKALRQKLIDDGFISEDRVKLMPRAKGKTAEEGIYQPKSIKTEEDYERKRAMYLYMVQDILIARRELNLDLGPVKSNEGWMF